MKLTFTNNTLPIGEIKITKEFSNTMPHLSKLKKCMDFYRTNGYFDRQIIVDSDKTLHDGYCAYITAVLMGAETVDVLMVGEKKAKKEPANESKPEPVKLYCFKGHRNLLTLGKIYTVPEDGKLIFDSGDKSYYDWKSKIPSTWPENLCALVRRPAKVGEWVLMVAVRDPSEHSPYVHNGEIRLVDAVDGRGRGTHSAAQKEQCSSWLWEDEYLVLDGYHGDPT